MAQFPFRTCVVVALALLASAGCSSAPRDAGFGDVAKTVAQATGQRAHWDHGTAPDRAAQASVDDLLSRELTPNAAVQVALLNNAGLQATYEDLGVAQADLVRAGLLRNPVFSGDIKFVEGGGGEIIELSVVQNFLDVFQIPVRQRAATAELEAAKLRVSGEAIDLAGRVRVALFELQAARQSLELRKGVLAARKASFEFAQKLRDSGNATALELASERVTFEQASVDVASAEAGERSLRERVNVLLGLWGARTQWTVAAKLPDVPADDAALVADAERRALEHSLEMRAARGHAEAAALALGVRRKFAWLGELDAGAAAERDPGEGWSVGPSVSAPLPIFDTGAASVAAARAELRRSEKALRATEVKVRSAARGAQDALAAARQRVVQYQQVIIPLRTEITRQTQLHLNAMTTGAFELLDAKRQEVEAGAAWVDALRDYWLTRVRLEQLLTGGRMTALDGGAAD